MPKNTPWVITAARRRGRNVRWLVIGIISALTIANYLDRGNLSVAAPLILKELGISATMMGVILSAFVWPYAIMNLPTGWLADRFGAKVLLAFAAGLWSLVSILTGFAANVGQFIGLRVLLGVSEAPLFPGALKATNAWFPDHEKAAAISVYIAATQVGLALAPPLATALMVAFGWLMIYDEPSAHRGVSEAELAYIRSAQATGTRDAAAPATAREWAALFRYPSTWIMIVGGFCLQYTFWFYISWLPTYLERIQHVTISHAGYLAALPFVAGALGLLIGGRTSDWLVARGVEAFTARRAVIAVGALLTGLCMLATTCSAGTTAAVALLTLGMFTCSLSSGCYWTLATNVLTTSRLVASIASIQNFGGLMGGACAPIVTGVLVDRFGGFDAAIGVTAVLALYSAAAYGLVLRRRIPL